MPFWNRLWFGLCVGWLGLWLTGCAHGTPQPSNDQRAWHFLHGESRLDAKDYQGAIRAFEESLEVNPRSAPAHFELGRLYDQAVSDPAMAIYHYEQYLKIEPDASNADAVKQRIEACKQKLAVAIFSLPSTTAEQRQLEELVEQHQRLQDELRQLRANLNSWSADYASLMAARTNSSLVVSNPAVVPPTVQPSSVQPEQMIAALQPPAVLQTGRLADPARRSVGSWRTHTVAAGETAFRIARHYEVSLNALLAANPGLKPRRMAVGQVLNIPLPSNQMFSHLTISRTAL